MKHYLRSADGHTCAPLHVHVRFGHEAPFPNPEPIYFMDVPVNLWNEFVLLKFTKLSVNLWN